AYPPDPHHSNRVLPGDRRAPTQSPCRRPGRGPLRSSRLLRREPRGPPGVGQLHRLRGSTQGSCHGDEEVSEIPSDWDLEEIPETYLLLAEAGEPISVIDDFVPPVESGWILRGDLECRGPTWIEREEDA